MKVKTFLYLFFCTLQTSWALDSVVTVFQTPIFKKPSTNADIIQYARKGDHLFIHNKHSLTPDYEINYNIDPYKNRPYMRPDQDEDDSVSEDMEEMEFEIMIEDKDNFNDERFYTTLAKSGQKAFVLKKHVKIIYNDYREFKTKITPYKFDNTDHRLEEPLPPLYPLYKKDGYRSSLAFGISPQKNITYSYNESSHSEDITPRLSLLGSYSLRVNFDKQDRSYFGGMIKIESSINTITMGSGREATEHIGTFGIGPYLSHDSFRTKHWLITLSGGATLNFHRALITQKSSDKKKEQRTFQGFSFTPKLGSTISIRNLFPKTNFFIGSNLSLTHGHSLKSNSAPHFESLWNKNDDRIKVAPSGDLTFFAGIRSQY